MQEEEGRGCGYSATAGTSDYLSAASSCVHTANDDDEDEDGGGDDGGGGSPASASPFTDCHHRPAATRASMTSSGWEMRLWHHNNHDSKLSLSAGIVVR